MKKLISLALCLALALSLAACAVEIGGLKDATTATSGAKLDAAANPTSSPGAQTTTSPSAEPQPGGMVELTVPAAFFAGSTFDDIKAACDPYGVEVSQNPDGSYLYKMTREQQAQFLSDQKEAFDSGVREILDSGYYPEIKDIQYNEDYSEVTITVDMAAAEESQFFGLAVQGLAMAAPLYQAYQGKGTEAKSLFSLVDAATGQTFQTFTAPDDLVDGLGDEPTANSGGGLTLDALKQAAEKAGYLTDDGMGYDTDAGVTAVAGFEIGAMKDGFFKVEIEVLEFVSPTDAEIYGDYINADEYSIFRAYVCDKFCVEVDAADHAYEAALMAAFADAGWR